MNSLLFDAETFQVPTYAIYQRGLIASAGNSLATQDLVGHQVCMLYEENLASRHIRETLSTPRVEFASYFPMACFAATTGSVAVADFITWTALQALVVGKLDIEAKPISDAAPSLYYLLRPRFRPRSKMADACYKALRAELLRHTRAH